MIKTTGYEFKKFYADDSVWPEGAWYDDAEIDADGVDIEDIKSIQDSSIVRIYGGSVYNFSAEPQVSMETHFKRWKKKQTTTQVIVECDKAKFTEIVAAIKAAGGKVL